MKNEFLRDYMKILDSTFIRTSTTDKQQQLTCRQPELCTLMVKVLTYYHVVNLTPPSGIGCLMVYITSQHRQTEVRPSWTERRAPQSPGD